MATPAQVDVWVRLDVGKGEHFADVLDDDGERLFARAVANDQAGLEALLDRAGRHGTPGLVIDQPGSIAQLALAVAARRGTPVAYVPGLVIRRAADLYPGEAKTDRRDAYVLADTPRTAVSWRWPTRRPGPPPQVTTSTLTSRYRIAMAAAWDQLHARLTHRAAWLEHDGPLPVPRRPGSQAAVAVVLSH